MIPLTPQRPEPRLREPFFVVHDHVRWSDVDYSRIIRYDAYTRFFEVGEAELFRAAGLPFRTLATREDVTFPRRVLHQEYFSPSLLDERLEVRVAVGHVGTSSLTLRFDILGEDGRLCANGHMVLVAVHPGTFQKVEVPQEVREAVRPWTST